MEYNRLKVVSNLINATNNWYQMSRILVREGADTRTPGDFFRAVVQAFLIFCSDMWVVTPRIIQILGGFHRMVARHITHK